MLYETAEGGAGVLRHLVDDPGALRSIARAALEVCHFDPDTGEDRRRAEGAEEDCEAACYDCLMAYTNQTHHQALDRHLVVDSLLGLADGAVSSSPVAASLEDHLGELDALCASSLERDWLAFLVASGYRLPDAAQRYVEAAGTRPDFLYSEAHAAIYVDGPVHDAEGRAARDQAATAAMEDLGYSVVRFGHRDDWAAIAARYRFVFGQGDAPR